MAKRVWGNASLGGAVCLVGTLASIHLRHGLVTREDLLDALVLSAIVSLVGLAVEFWRAKRRAKATKSDAA